MVVVDRVGYKLGLVQISSEYSTKNCTLAIKGVNLVNLT